jgi:hypothetical protein
MNKPHIVIALHFDTKAEFALAGRLMPLGCEVRRLVLAGMSSAYTAFAQRLQGANHGRVLPGLLTAVAASHKLADYRSIWIVSWSAPYSLVRQLLTIHADAEALTGWVSLDSGYASRDSDGTAADAQVAPFAAFTKRARRGEKALAIGFTDTPTHGAGKTGGYASTADFAAELQRMVGGAGGLFTVEHWAHDPAALAAAPDKAAFWRGEHIAARDTHGPAFVERAIRGWLAAQDEGDTPTSEPPAPTPPTRRDGLLRRGDRGEAVTAWQQLLSRAGFPCIADGDFGPRTEAAVVALQKAAGLLADGFVGPLTRAAAEAIIRRDPKAENIAFIAAKNFTPVSASSPRTISLIVIHTAEQDIRPGVARRVASWFAGRDAPQASAHYVVGPDEVIACVRETDVAWAAPGANHNGVQCELVGRASMTAADWHSPPAQAAIERLARLVAQLCRRHAIPVQRLSVDDLLAGARGICGHVEVSKAWKGSLHWDPGLTFPWPRLLELVAHSLSE